LGKSLGRKLAPYGVAPMSRRSYVLLGITAVAAIVRFATLDLQSFDHDEAVTAARVIHPSLFDTLSAVVDGERSPPLYYVLVWAWSKIFGTGEVGLRSLSALCGTLTVPLAYAAAAALGPSRRVALLAAAFVALNPYLIWYSQEARSYALMVLFAALALVYFARSLDRLPPRPPGALAPSPRRVASASHSRHRGDRGGGAGAGTTRGRSGERRPLTRSGEPRSFCSGATALDGRSRFVCGTWPVGTCSANAPPC